MSENNTGALSEITGFHEYDPGTFVIRAIQNDPTLQPSTKHQYIKAIENYLATGGSLTDLTTLAEYALTVGNSTRSFLARPLPAWPRSWSCWPKGAPHQKTYPPFRQPYLEPRRCRARSRPNPHKAKKPMPC